MSDVREIYRFAARAGALEGYVYHKQDIEPEHITQWVGHVVEEYNSLPVAVRNEFQDLCDATVGRAIQSLISALGEDHTLVGQLRTIVVGTLPTSPDDFLRAT
jgi:hypothetical protein